MAVFKTMTGRQRFAVAVGIAWMLFGLHMLTRETWIGLAWLCLGAVFVANVFYQAARDKTARADRQQ